MNFYLIGSVTFLGALFFIGGITLYSAYLDNKKIYKRINEIERRLSNIDRFI